MEYYNEYPVRCRTSNDPLSCYSSDYEAYLNAGFSIEDALNSLGIMNPCCRMAMANPTIVAFNMENREVIEGFKSVDAAEESEAQTESTSQPIFNSCMGVVAPIQNTKPVGALPSFLTAHMTRVPANAPGTQFRAPIQSTIPGVQAGLPILQPVIPGVQTITLMQPVIPVSQPVPKITEGEPPAILSPTLFQPIIEGIDMNNKVPVGVGIPVNFPDTNKFEEPTLVGVPTINHDPSMPQPTIFVGHDKSARVLNGRTFIAR